MSYSLQFFARKTKKDILEISEWFSEGKIRIGFRKYDESQSAGSKISTAIDFYMTVPEFELLCHNLLSGSISRMVEAGKQVPPYYKGNQRGDHQGNPLQQQGGNLVAQEFSPVPGLPRELSLLFLYKPRIQVVR